MRISSFSNCILGLLVISTGVCLAKLKPSDGPFCVVPLARLDISNPNSVSKIEMAHLTNLKTKIPEELRLSLSKLDSTDRYDFLDVSSWSQELINAIIKKDIVNIKDDDLRVGSIMPNVLITTKINFENKLLNVILNCLNVETKKEVALNDIFLNYDESINQKQRRLKLQNLASKMLIKSEVLPDTPKPIAEKDSTQVTDNEQTTGTPLPPNGKTSYYKKLYFWTGLSAVLSLGMWYQENKDIPTAQTDYDNASTIAAVRAAREEAESQVNQRDTWRTFTLVSASVTAAIYLAPAIKKLFFGNKHNHFQEPGQRSVFIQP